MNKRLRYLRCPKCDSERLRVLDSRVQGSPPAQYVKRRRECVGCKHRWNTREAEAPSPAGVAP